MKKLCMILPMAMVLCFMVGCQNQEAMVEFEEMKAQAEVEEQNKELVKHFYEAANERDFEAYKELLAPEYAWYVPSRNTEPISREGSMEFVRGMFDAFPDCHWSIEDLIAEGNIVVSRFIFRGTHEGEYQGIPATGNKIEISGFMMARIENGKIVEDKEDVDLLGFMQQLGMELKPKEEK